MYNKIIVFLVVSACSISFNYAQSPSKEENIKTDAEASTPKNAPVKVIANELPVKNTAKPDLELEVSTLQKNRLTHQYSNQTVKLSVGNHLLLNMFSGMFGGALIGGLIGFYGVNFTSGISGYSSLFITAGIFSGVGILGGATVFAVEYFKNKQFAYGKKILAYSIYGSIVGGIFGAMTGSIIYAANSSQNTYLTIVRGIGYGALGGAGAGLLLYFVFEHLVPKKKDVHLTFNIDPLYHNYGGAIQFRF